MKTITTTYAGPDLDGYGCAMAYAELLQAQGMEAQAHVWGTPQLEVRWLLETFELPHAQGPIDDASAEVVLLDASNPDNLPALLKIQQVVEVIDHRQTNKATGFLNARICIELVGAAATLVGERFLQAGIQPSRSSALFLYGGIISNTQNFTGITTDRDRTVGAWLKDLSCAPDDLAMRMFAAKSDLTGDRLRETLFADLKTLNIHGRTFSIAQLEIVGVNGLLAQRREEIEGILQEIQRVEKADYTFANMLDVEQEVSTLLCVDEKTAELLRQLPDATWNGRLCISPTVRLRKQLTAWIAEQI